MLRLYDPVTLIAAGVEVVPSFRSPPVTLAFGDLDLGLATLEAVEHEVRKEPLPEGLPCPTSTSS